MSLERFFNSRNAIPVKIEQPILVYPERYSKDNFRTVTLIWGSIDWTGTVIQTRVSSTWRDFAIGTGKTDWAGTFVRRSCNTTNTIVFTRFQSTWGDLTIHPGKPGRACTLIRTFIDGTRATILAWVGSTRGDFAVDSRIPSRTLAVAVRAYLHFDAAVLAGNRIARAKLTVCSEIALNL